MRTLLLVSLFALGCGSAGRSGGVADAKSTAGDGATAADGAVEINPGFGPGPWGASCTCTEAGDCASGLVCAQHSFTNPVHWCEDPADIRHECATNADCGCGGVCVHGTTGSFSDSAYFEACYPPCDAACKARGACDSGACMDPLPL